MQSSLGWSRLEAPMTGRATQTDGPALACRGPACASGEQLSACSCAAKKVPSPILQAPLSSSAGPILDERNLGPFLLQASMNAGVSKRIPQAGLFYLPFASGEQNKDRPRVPWGGAGERGLVGWHPAGSACLTPPSLPAPPSSGTNWGVGSSGASPRAGMKGSGQQGRGPGTALSPATCPAPDSPSGSRGGASARPAATGALP